MKLDLDLLKILSVLTILSSCQKTVVNEAAGNSQTILDASDKKEVTGQDLTINRIRIVRASPSDSAPGVASIRDLFYVDVWGTLSGETLSRKSTIGPFQADPDGNLYAEGAEPGTILYNSSIAAAVGTDISYTITAKDGLIVTEWDKVVEQTTTLSDTAATSTVKNTLVSVSSQDATFTNIRARTYATSALFTRNRYQDNSDFSLKGKLGCFNKTTAASGDTSYAEKPTFYDVELGATLSDTDGVISTTKAASGDASASDQILRVLWKENWYVTGVNINTRTIRIVRERSAPFYMNRELPKRTIAVSASGASAISGMETMIRSCSNAVETTTGSMTFQTAGFTVSSGATTYTNFNRLNGTGASHCAGTKSVATTVALTTAFSGGATVFAGCGGLTNSTFGLVVGAGTWNGTYSASTISSVTSGTFTFLDHSAIVDVVY
ncbi:MAG: hypothetical protein NT027_16635 [Proteobacteria bacterium]|nr:hypothetical protein [Pseudomonadota bacterium]